jgi:6-phosphogluconolactonase
MIPQLCRWQVSPNPESLRDAAVAIIDREARQAIATSGEFHIVLSGGNTPRAVHERLVSLKTDWSAWHIYFGDERCLPTPHPERNSCTAHDAWLGCVGIPPMQIHMIPAELGAVRAAQEYTKVLREVGEFDLVMLGLGEDGHTASLFPGHEWGTAENSPDVLAVHDAPKPPPERVSLSAARLSRARRVMFLVSGASKRDAVSKWRAGELIPASAIAPQSGVDVLLESAATNSNFK